MPRVADHDQRRDLLARAFCGQVARHGLPATTFARVAEDAGVSVGLIQHYFASKDELLRFAYADCLRRRDARIAQHIADGAAAEQPIRSVLAAALDELFPLDEQRSVEHRVIQSLHTQALHDPSVAEIAQRTELDLHGRASTAVSNGKECGEVAPDVDSDVAAARILAVAHGLALRLTLTAVPTLPDDAAAVVGPVLDTVFTGRCHHYDR